MKRRRLSRYLAPLLAILLLFSLVGCGAARRVRPSANANKTVARVGELKIPYDELYYLANSHIADLKAERGENALDDPAVRAELETFVKSHLLTETQALLLLAKERGIEVDSGEIGELVQEKMEEVIESEFEGSRKAYIESLNAAYLTDRYVRTFIAVDNYLAAAVIEDMLKKGELDDSDATAKAFMEGDDLIRVYQVLIENKNYGSAENARAKIDALRANVLAADESGRVQAMHKAMQFSTAFDDGNGLYFAKGEMESAFEEAAFALPLYGVSEVLAVEGGYTFVMRMPKDAAYMQQHFEALKQKTYFVALNRMLDERLETLTLEMTDYGNSLDLTALPAIDADGGETVLLVVWIAAGAVTVGAIAFAGSRVAKAAGAKRKGAKK